MVLATMKDISNRFGGCICRRCINMNYDAKLTRDDCKYTGREECPSCEEVRHLVSGFTLSGKAKMRGLSYSGEDMEYTHAPFRVRTVRTENAEKVERTEDFNKGEMRELRTRLRKREQQVDALYRELDDMTAKYRELAVVMRDSANAILEVTEGVIRPEKKLSVL